MEIQGNIKKAEEIAVKWRAKGLSYNAIYDSCLEMAQWKDEQLENKLQEIVDYVYPLICGGERLHINEIIGKDMKWKH